MQNAERELNVLFSGTMSPQKKQSTRHMRRRLSMSSQPVQHVGDGVIDNLISDLKENAFRRPDAAQVWVLRYRHFHCYRLLLVLKKRREPEANNFRCIH